MKIGKRMREALLISHIKPWYLILTVLIIVAYPHVFTKSFQQNLGILILMWACLGSAWNIFGGYTGQVSLGQAMFFGVGAYGAVLPFYYWNVTPWIGMLIGMFFATLLALLVALPIFKLSAQYFAIATMALGETVRIIAVNLPFTKGMMGIDFLNMKMNPWYSLQFRGKLHYYYFFGVILMIVISIMIYINSSRIGYYFRTIKVNQTAAESVGINARKYKTIALVISACIASLCGSFYAMYQTYIDPSTVFINTLSTKMIIMAVIGGVGTIYGPVIGAALIVPLGEYTRATIGATISGIDLVLYGVLIILTILYQPQGVLKLSGNLIDKVRKMTAGRSADFVKSLTKRR